jgi:hypothetical protein
MEIDDTAFSEMVSAIIVQAAMDFTEAYKLGLIKEPSDIYSASWFLFQSEALDEIIPAGWPVSPDAVRRAIVAAAKAGKRINHF